MSINSALQLGCHALIASFDEPRMQKFSAYDEAACGLISNPKVDKANNFDEECVHRRLPSSLAFLTSSSPHHSPLFGFFVCPIS
jgi:hypothetical protein